MADQQIAEATQLLIKRLREVMEQHGLTSRKVLADYLGISQGTIGSYFWLKKPSLPTPETLQRLREKIPAITDEDARVLETAYPRKPSQSRSRASEKYHDNKRTSKQATATTPEITRQTMPSSSPDDKDAKIGRLVRQLLTEVAQNGNLKATISDPLALLHSHANERYQIGDMPAVLTKENFAGVNVSQWSEAEQQQFLGYANLVLEESRKCLLLLAQFTPDQTRDELLERLARNADLLWRTYKAASSVAPIEYVKDIELARKCEKL